MYRHAFTWIKPLRPTLSFSLFACVLITACKTSSHTPIANTTPEVVSVKKIWDAGNHNAFTDLIRFDGRWFCTFRESESHIAGNGKIRVITSHDGERWESAALVEEAGVDLRDPKLSITADHRLMLTLGGTVHEGSTVIERQPRVAFSKDGFAWSAPERVLGKGDWLWRVTWHDGHAYGIVYAATAQKGAAEWTARFVESADGIHYRTISNFEIPNRPNEATARFLKNGDCVVLIRREAGDKSAWIGTSSAPYEHWTWKPAGMFVGGPNFIVLDDGSMIAAGRQMHPAPLGAKTFVGQMNASAVTPQLTLPSGGDCSYPGLVWQDGSLWMSYYSSHEGKTSIYLAKLKY